MKEELIGESSPYLSVVVTARNDDHGGNLLRRMQIFVDGWIAQTNRHGLSSELIVVEWNPPEDRQPLADALSWPANLGLCTVRFIHVPHEVHVRYAHADALPLYQMIAKNVGIRRARGRFVLATNIDILFNDELVHHLAEHGLQAGRMYRIDRHDVMSDVPLDASIDEQLAHCRTHMIRINAREGTCALTQDGLRALEAQDVAEPSSGITFGAGWFALERHSHEEVFRWAENDAEVVISQPTGLLRPLLLDLEPGPGVARRTFRLQVLDAAGSVAAEIPIHTRSTLVIDLPRGTRLLRLRALDGGLPITDDPRILNFRIFRCAWTAQHQHTVDTETWGLTVYPQLRPAGTLITNPTVRKTLRFYRETRSIPGTFLALARHKVRARKLAVAVEEGEDVFQLRSGIRPGEGWCPLEHCMGETFRWVRKNARITVQCPNQAPAKLLLQVEPGPGVNYRPFELMVRDQHAEIVAGVLVRGLEMVELPLPLRPGEIQSFWLTLEGGDRPAPGDTRILNFRVFWCGWSTERSAAMPSEDVPPPIEKSETPPPVFLHTNACGDFTLMAREHWLDLRGYPEFDMYSMNLDSVLCYAAHHAGFREEVLRDPMRAYHIEHGAGSGWTPEGQAKLYARLSAQGVQYLGYEQLVSWAAHMRQLNCPMIFNLDNWGLAAEVLLERVLSADSCSSASG